MLYPVPSPFTQMLKTKSSRADFFHSDQKRVLVLNGVPLCASRPATQPLIHSHCNPRSGLVLCYYEPTKHTDYPEQKAKGYLPLWMLSKVEADVSLAIPQFSLHYGTDTFTFKGLHPALQWLHRIVSHMAFSCSFAARKRFPDPARDFVTVQCSTVQPHFSYVPQELLSRCDFAQKCGIMTGALSA